MKELALKLLKMKYDEQIALEDLKSRDYMKLHNISREIFILEYLLTRTGITQEEIDFLKEERQG